MKGLSARNLRYMRDFALAWPDLQFSQQSDNLTAAIWQQPVAKLPWGHCCVLLDRLNSAEEMGKHFSFVGRQVHLKVGQHDFYVDVLLYNFRIHAFVVLEIKLGEFKPEYAGKMGFYLSAVDDKYKSEIDGPSIGLILCKSKEEIVVEYTLRNINRPMGVSQYKLTEDIPNTLQSMLPSIELLKEELVKDIGLPAKSMGKKIAGLKTLLDKS